MSATILTVSGDKRIDLLNGQLIRRPIYLHNWTTVRIGVRFCIPSLSSIPGTPRLYIGMCNGLTNGIGDSVTTNFVGMITNTATLTRTSLVGPPLNVYTGNNAFRVVKKVASTTTLGAGDSSGLLFMSMQAPVRLGFILQIAKGSPNYTMQFALPVSNGTTALDLTDAEMTGFMEMTNMSDASTIKVNWAGGAFTNNTIATDETAGVFNAINVFWDRTAAPLEISDIWHRKVA